MKHTEHYNFAIAILAKKAKSNDFNEVLEAINKLEGMACTVFCYEELHSKRHLKLEKLIKESLLHMKTLTEYK